MVSACILSIINEAILAATNWGVPKCLDFVSPQLGNLVIKLWRWTGYYPSVENQNIKYITVASIENTKNAVYEALEKNSVIGLWGMGGLGKTTLMRQINNEMAKRVGINLVVWVEVSKNQNIKTIQKQIARRLCSEEQLEKFNSIDDPYARASTISDHLKKFESLIIFNDVWEDLNFIEIGIATNDRILCKIVLTCRDQGICQRVGAEQIKMITSLDETESWEFFKEYSDIGNNPIHPRIKNTAEEICRKCAGLPLAISVVANALRPQIIESKWNRCLEYLNEGCPQWVDNLVKYVYLPLKYSYESLNEEDDKIGFLLCSLFPQGQEIQLSDLICYGMGVDKYARNFKGKKTLDAYRNIFINLKRKGLLQDVVEEKEDEKENSARMHDIIWDVAIYIAQNEFDGFFNKEKFIKWSSPIQNLNSIDRPHNINAVQFLSFNGNKMLEGIHPDFFEGMGNLLFLDLRGTSISMEELTETCLQKLLNLRVFMFKTFLNNITVNITDLFFLQHLSVLYLQNVHISELNQEFSQKLVHLRVIDFSDTVIDIIRPKVFSRLRNTLEELNMQGSYNKWQTSNEEAGDLVAFDELKDLKNLYSLHLDIYDERIFSPEFAPSLIIPPVECFSIRSTGNNNNNKQRVWTSNILILSRIQLNNVAKWLQVLFARTKALHMHDFDMDRSTQATDSVLEQYVMNLLSNLKALNVGVSTRYKNLIQYNTGGDPILPKLEHITLTSMVGMENIFVSTVTPAVVPPTSFERLGRIIIFDCDRLKFVFPWNVVECLVCLEELRIFNCSQLENIIGTDDQGVNGSIARALFPKLSYIKLSYLPNLECVWKQEIDEKVEMEWHSLKYLDVEACEKLRRLFFGEKSAPSMYSINCQKEWFNNLHWEDRQAESRFSGVMNDLSRKQKKISRLLFLLKKRTV